jgi:ABC-type transport system involved in cytochrome c biogenesis ATPase subunit/GNAT superfamily N-acetyltransferase
MPTITVATSTSRLHERILMVEGAKGNRSELRLGRFALVGPGDRLRVRNGASARLVELQGEGNTWITVEPSFRVDETLRIGLDSYPITFSEISSKDEFIGYERLESFHYKGRSLNDDPLDPDSSQKSIGGRKAVVVAKLSMGHRSRVVGYIELQMPLMMCKPRHDLFHLAFAHPSHDVSWETWLGDGQRYVNRIVRIARVVVDPEFRGLGLSSALVKQAKTFARDRWTIGQKRPLFIEISAEMLRYIDFVTKAGLRYVGSTEGNLKRILRDLESIENGASGKSQIMGLQKKYHAAFSLYCKETGHSFDEARAILSERIKSHKLRDVMPADEWLAFRPILRLPIPYHIAGLDEPSERYVRECLAARGENKARGPTLTKRSTQLALKVVGLEVWVDQKLKLTPYVRLAMDSFGIDTSRVRTKLVGPMDVDLVGGNICLITGASGAGKSVILQALKGKRPRSGLLVKGTLIASPRRVRELKALPEGIPLLQYFGKRYGTEAAFDALCRVGLSEALVFVKPYSLLSMGQRYRAMLADLLLSKADVWLIDEFCSNVDPITAAVIAGQIRRLARKLGVIVVAAAANVSHFVDALAPDTIFVVRTGGDVSNLSLKEFKAGHYEKGI